MRRFSQSIHVNPETTEGVEILSVLLAVPAYERGALVRGVLAAHIRRAARTRYPGLTPKTPGEVADVLAQRAARRPRRRRPSLSVAPPDPVALSTRDAPPTDPEALDLEARLDQLQF
mgnify:FL=1